MEQFQKDYISTRIKNNEKVKQNREGEIKFLKDHKAKMQFKPTNDPELIDQIGILERKKQMEENKNNEKQKKEKIDNYGKYVREMYWPKVSVKK